ncbi:T9SS type A sorting domain-containing protein [candidate division WOR-3 bacterium]|nr:T9SS type A sorting domain-containing protein [candidate division WOR-3 bacterium]
MKNSLLTAIAVGWLLVMQPAPAQTVLMSQDFNGSWSTASPPTGWRIYCDEGDTSTNDWHRAPDLGANPWSDNPTPYALLDSGPSEVGDDSLISPLVNCSGYNVVVLRCSTFFKGSLRPGYRAQLLGAVDGGPLEHLIFDYSGMVIGPALQDFNLSWAVGYSQVQVGWVFGGYTEAISYWAIDNVSILGDNVNDDVGCLAILAPTDTADTGDAVIPKARFKNFNASEPATFPVQMTIGQDYSAIDTVRDLAAGDSTTVTFSTWNAAPRGDLPVAAMSILRGDTDPSNDTVRGAVFVRVRDVGCVAVTAPRDTIDSGLPVQPMARIQNHGNDTATFYAQMRIKDWVDSTFVDRMPPGQEWEIVFPVWSANASLWTTARCSTAWTEDRAARNDTASRRFFVKPPHYKDMAAIRILAPTGVVGESATVVPSGIIRSYCDDPQLATTYFTICDESGVVYQESMAARTVQPRESVVVEFPAWVAGGEGRFTDTLRVWLEGDADPSNDAVASEFEVRAELHDVGVVVISSPADTVFTGPVTPRAQVKNYGWFTETFYPKCRILRGAATVYYDSAPVTDLGPGESRLVVFPTWTAGRGTYTVRCTTDVPGDLQPANDWLQKNFAVIDIPIPPGWAEVASMPVTPSGKDIKDGGWLVYYAGNGRIFGSKGNKQADFYEYFPLGDSWRLRAAWLPGPEQKPPQKGSAACTDGNSAIYATKGNNTLEFCKYDVAKDSWYQLPDVPLGPSRKKVKGGTGLVYRPTAGGQVYLLKGYKNEFYRYHTEGDTWQELPSAPGAKWDKGSWIVFDGVRNIYAHMAKQHLFYAYNTETDVWDDTLQGMLFEGANGSKKAKDGSCADWFDGTILALKGGNTQECWRYFVTGDTWQQLDTIPQAGSAGRKKVKTGAGLANLGAGMFYASKGGKSREFWRYRFAGGVDVREEYLASVLPRSTTGLDLYPNPATGAVSVRLPSLFSLPARLSVYDIRGNLVQQRTAGAATLALDLRPLPPGVYFVQALDPDTRVTGRVVKQ